MKENINHINKNCYDLIKDNRNLSESYSLNQFVSSFENLNQKIDKQDELIDKDKINRQLSKDIIGKLKDLSDEIREQREQSFVNNSLP